MHHSLRIYGQQQHRLLHLYISLARLTKIPVVGALARGCANLYGRLGHSGYSLTLAEAEQIVDLSKDVSLGPCSCRHEFRNCENPLMSEIVLGNGGNAVYASRVKEFLTISKDEAKKVLREAHERKLTQSIMRCGGNFYAICNCCTCCCVPLRLRQRFGIGRALVRNPHVVEDYKKQQLN